MKVFYGNCIIEVGQRKLWYTDNFLEKNHYSQHLVNSGEHHGFHCEFEAKNIYTSKSAFHEMPFNQDVVKKFAVKSCHKSANVS